MTTTHDTTPATITVPGLRILAAGVAGPGYPDTAPPLTGFVESEFNPLVHRAAWPCLTAAPGEHGDGARTGLVLASLMGDATTTDLASRQLVAGRVHNAILFMQATANAVLGHLAREFGRTGPLLALSTPDVSGELLDTARLWLADGELDQVLVVGVELAGTERTTAAYRALGLPPPAHDLAVALLVTRSDPPDTGPIPAPGPGLDLLLRLATATPSAAHPAASVDAGADHRGAQQ